MEQSQGAAHRATAALSLEFRLGKKILKLTTKLRAVKLCGVFVFCLNEALPVRAVSVPLCSRISGVAARAGMRSLRSVLLSAALLASCLYSSLSAVPPIPTGKFAGYLSYEQTVEYVNSLRTALPHLVGQPKVMGKSVEGRDVIAFCIGTCSGKRSKTFMTGLTHSREV